MIRKTFPWTLGGYFIRQYLFNFLEGSVLEVKSYGEGLEENNVQKQMYVIF